MGGPFERYHKLGLRASFTRVYQYAPACKELGSIVKLSYSKFPKKLQSLIFQDVLTAIRLLPLMQTQTALSAANILLQSVESVLPKQKKAMAVTEFKHAMVAHKRCSKARPDEEGSSQLPQDILVHVFSFLDLKSLVSASQVCRSWNAASSDTHLWKALYTLFSDTFHNFSEPNMPHGGSIEDKRYKCLEESIVSESSRDWRTICKKTYEGISLKKWIASSRGFCKHCNAIIWLSDIANKKSRFECKYHRIKPISARQIVEYVDGEYDSSESDSDSDDESTSKLWAYPKRSVFSL